MADYVALNPAVVLTVSPTGLAVARSLASRGVAVWGIDDQDREIGHSSRSFRFDPALRYLSAGPELLEGLLRFGKAQALPPVLFVAGDPYMDFVAEHHEALREHFVLPEGMRPEVASSMLDKRSFYERCQALDTTLPATFFPADESDARAAALELRYPAIVKPTHAHVVRSRLGGDKLVEVQDAESLVTWWLRMRDWGSDAVLQEIIPGAEANLFVGAVYMDAQLECRSLFTARKSRQYPPWYGSGSYMEASWSQEIADLSVDLLRRLEYRGVAGTEFKWDARDETWKLIEINPRPTLWFALPPAAGVDVIWDAYCDLVGRPNEIHVNQQDDRIRWQLLVRDLVSGWYFLRRGDLSLREFLRTVIDPRRKTYAILSWRDPGTLLAYPRNTLWKYLRTRADGSE
jgi:predicted ATP-grasp superfamily ATP-dependent carboligase